FTYNPGTAPGGPAPDATMCTHLQGSIEDTPTRCSARWQSGSQWFHSHGTTGLSPAPFAANIGTFYADVSFGNLGGFDTAGDGLFSEDKYQHGFFEAPAGLALESALPAGVDDAHVYGDENCGSIDPLDTAAGGTDASYSEGTISPIGTNWSCDREAWATDAGADFDCEDAVDERDCYMLPKVGDGYDFRDVECQDNDVLGESTTDSEGILAGTGQEGRSCQSLTPAPS
ncbi:MAG: hypothetical protein R3185_01605, partial [Candidatus Thermoplasmatota archaeon]|nr:hypothetical protein [Candidatus Thermoplasmatota archaeon]